MDLDQRLAAYLSGDLDADEREALEAQLADDEALRERLEAIRAMDATLADLPEIELPDGFSDRLRDRLAPEVDLVLGDELAARRARRRLPTWAPAAAAAAALVLVVGGGIAVVTGLGGSDSADMATTGDAPEALDDAAGAQPFQESADAGPGPRVIAEGRSITAGDLEQLAADPSITGGLDLAAVDEDPTVHAADWAAALTSSARDFDALGLPATSQALSGAGDGEAGTDEDAPAAPEETTEAVARLSTAGAVTADDLDDISRCLSVLFEDAADPVIPLYAEVATDDDGTPILVYAALSPNADGEYRRVEVWMVERATCTLRLFHQADHAG